jgi:hypothetical protein
MIGSDPRYQSIIDAYRAGEMASTAPQYNPIYDIRREQIEAGELEEGARFPRPQLDTTPAPVEEGEGGGGVGFDPCPPGYQLIDGVCQPDSMFNQGRDQEYTGPKITDGIIEGYQELEPMQQKMGTFYQTLSPAMKAEYEKASSYGRGIQFKRDPQGNVIRIVAKSPTFGQLMGDIGGGMGSMLGSIGDAAQQYLSGGGMLGYLANLFAPKEPTVRYGGGSTMTVTETGQPMIPTDSVIPTGIVRPGYPTEMPTPSIVREPLPPIEKYVAQQELLKEMERSERDRQPSVPRAGTGRSGPPGRDYSAPARTRAAQAAKKLGTKLATRGK